MGRYLKDGSAGQKNKGITANQSARGPYIIKGPSLPRRTFQYKRYPELTQNRPENS